MWNPTENWQAQTSFGEPVAPPGVEPTAAPEVQLCFSAAWLPYILGALKQLAQPPAWVATGATLQTVLDQAQDLIELFATAEACEVLAFRYTAGCELQYSLDGGATYTTVPGWDTYAAACYLGPGGTWPPAGPPAAGGVTPPLNPQGATVSQQGCNIAGYLATYVVQAAVHQAVTSIQASESKVQFYLTLLGILQGPDLLADLALLAANALYDDIAGGVLAQYTYAQTDATLWEAVTCAIFNAINADGYVTAANLSVVLSNIAAIIYLYPAVVGTIHDFASHLGIDGFALLQQPGALAVINCSGCTGSTSNSALSFQTSLGQTLVALASDLVVSGNFTLGGWYSGSSATAISRFIVAGFTGGSQLIELFTDSSGFPGAVVQNLVGGVGATTWPHDNHTGNHLIALVLNNTQLLLYVDGVNVSVAARPTGSYNAPGAVAHFGGCAGCGNLNAVLWRWARYDYEVSGTDMLTWFNAGTFGIPPPGFTNFWPFSEGSGTTIHDAQASNNGTVSGPLTWVTHT